MHIRITGRPGTLPPENDDQPTDLPASRHRRAAHLLGRLLLLCVILITVCVLAFLAWVGTGKRSVVVIAPAIIQQLLPEKTDYTVSVRDALLSWKPGEKALHLEVVALKAVRKQGDATYLDFPRLELGVSLPHLLLGRIQVTHAAIEQPHLWVLREPEGRLRLQLGEGQQSNNAGILAAFIMDDSSHLLSGLDTLVVRDAYVKLRDVASDKSWEIPGADLTMQRHAQGMEIRLMTQLESSSLASQAQSERTTIDIHMDVLREQKRAAIRINHTNLRPERLAAIADILQPLALFNVPLSGWIDIDIDFNGVIQLVDFQMAGGGAGFIELPGLFHDSLPVTNMKLKGSITEGLRTILLEECQFDLDGPVARMKGLVSMEAEGFSLDADLHLANVSAEQLSLYWPLILAPKSRKWVIENVSEGHLSEAQIQFRIQPGDDLNIRLPREDIKATLFVEDATIQYLPEFPRAVDVDATLEFTENAMSATITEASTGQVNVADGSMAIDDLLSDNPYLSLSLPVNVNAAETVRWLTMPALDLGVEELKLNPEQAQGSVDATVDVAVQLGSGVDNTPTVNVVGQAREFAMPSLLDQFDIRQAAYRFRYTPEGFSLDGDAQVNGLPMQLNLSQVPSESSQARLTQLTTTFSVDITEIEKAFDIAIPDIIVGPISVQTHHRLGEESHDLQATVDVKDAYIDISPLGYIKPPGKEGEIVLKAAINRDDAIDIPMLAVTTPGLKAELALQLEPSDYPLKQMTIRTLKTARNELQGKITRHMLADGSPRYEGEVNGSALDVGNLYSKSWLFDVEEETKEPTASNATTMMDKLPAVDISIGLMHVTLGEDRELNDVKAVIRCSKELCYDVQLSALTRQAKPLSFTLATDDGGRRTISAAAADGGELIRVLGISDDISSGRMELSGWFDDSTPVRPLHATLIFMDFTAGGIPVLAKLLNVASIAGIGELLSGEGIGFSKLTMPFELADGIFHIRNAKSLGSSLGITADGTIDTMENTINLGGTLVPSYALNRLVGEIPLVGKALVGGEDQGLFAFNFRTSGSLNDPDVSVNPLSILTPGFLRGVFGDPAKAQPSAQVKQTTSGTALNQPDRTSVVGPFGPRRPRPAAEPQSTQPN